MSDAQTGVDAGRAFADRMREGVPSLTAPAALEGMRIAREVLERLDQ